MGNIVFLIVSNLAFVFPSAVAGCMRLFPEALVYGTTAAVSGVYHYLDATGTKCLVHAHVCYATLSFMDFVYAYTMIALTLLLESSFVSCSAITSQGGSSVRGK